MQTISDIIAKGVAVLTTSFPEEWAESTVLRMEDEILTITYNNGTVVLTTGDISDPQSIIQLTKKRLCDIIDGSIDFMIVWRELAEPSPTDRTYILKGSGAKLFTLLDGLIKCYRSNESFKKLLDGYKAGLTSNGQAG